MGKRKPWWKGTDYDDEDDLGKMFPNSSKQHNKSKEVYIYDDEEDRVASPYSFDWGLERKLTDKTGTQNNVDTYRYAKDEFNSGYGGGWKGYDYYKKPQLSYKYVQQMANALSSKHKIKVQIGNDWNVDLKSKTLTYNPTSLIYGTKSELLATLMHEIGKLRYCQHPSDIKEKYLAMYGVPAAETFSIFEDVRADYHMLKAYESAGEIYESAIPMIDKKVDEYRRMSEMFKKVIVETIHGMVKRTIADAQQRYGGFSIDVQNEKIKMDMLSLYGVETPDEVMQKIAELVEIQRNNGTIFDYCGEMLHVMYDTDIADTSFENIKEKVAQTDPYVETIKKKNTSQEVADAMSNTVFPIVEDLLKQFHKDSQTIQDLFPNMPEQMKQEIAALIQAGMSNYRNGGRVNTGKDGNSVSRTSGSTGDRVPQEWLEGDYKVLKDTVLSEIKTLVSKLTFLRREEMAVRYEGHQRRGKLNSKQLYKSATGSKRVFKNRLPNSNTVQSFAFSILIDTSGSMSGSRMAHTTRALVILTEVFKKMDIPFEIITFANGAKHVKTFSEVVDKSTEKKIAGLADKASGSTELQYALDEMKLLQQPEKNKVCVVLTDGGVGDHKWFDKQYFEPLKDKGGISVAFGLECGKDVETLCMGNSKSIENASTLPIEFAELIKGLIRRKK